MTRVMKLALPAPGSLASPRKGAVTPEADFGARLFVLTGAARHATPPERPTPAAREATGRISNTGELAADQDGDSPPVLPEAYALLMAFLAAPALPQPPAPEALAAGGHGPASAAIAGVVDATLAMPASNKAVADGTLATGGPSVAAAPAPPSAEGTPVPSDLLTVRAEPLAGSAEVIGRQPTPERSAAVNQPEAPAPALGTTAASTATSGDVVAPTVHARHGHDGEPGGRGGEEPHPRDLLQPETRDASASHGTTHTFVEASGGLHRLDPPSSSGGGSSQPSPLAEQVVDQVQNAITTRQTSVRVRLEPDALGPIDLTLVARDGGIAVRMVVDNHDTQHMLLRDLHDLRRGLSDRGFAVQHIQVEGVARTSTDAPRADVSSGTPQSHAGARQGQGDPGAGRHAGWRGSIRSGAAVDAAGGVASAPPDRPVALRADGAIDLRA